MNSSPTPGLHPLNGCVLVELKQSYKSFTAKESKYDSRTEGVVVAIPDVAPEEFDYMIPLIAGKRIHFEEFKEGARIKRGTKIYSFIKLEDIRGFEDVEAS